MNKLQIGQKIYYTGDQANYDGWFVITGLRDASYDLTEILPVAEIIEQRKFLGVSFSAIGNIYHGHCNPRFVTKEAHKAYSEAALAMYHKA